MVEITRRFGDRRKINLQTNIKFEDHRYQDFMKDTQAAGIKAVVQMNRDPITGTTELCVYTDDGHGNGTLMFSFQMD